MTRPDLPTRYAVHALLGEGASGRVYRVRDAVHDQDVALKLVTPAESTFLRREFDTLRQIRHENLIQVFDWGSLPSGEAYYTMELVEGEDWGRWMGSPQSESEVRRILTGILRGLAHLHCHGEIHGDLKPGNILLGRGGLVKVADAGMGGTRGEVDGRSGTPGYAAPEVWEGRPANDRADLYSIGVMAYEALTGRHPFGAKTIREVVAGQMQGWVPSPAAQGVHLAPDIERAVMRALERDPALRQATPDEFMEGLGIEDRTGRIVAGRYVGREESMERVASILFGTKSGEPTLLQIEGPPGSGRASFINEVAHRVTAKGGVVEEFSFDWAPEQIWTMSEGAPLFIRAEAASDERGALPPEVTALARHIWALSLDRSRPARLIIATTIGGPERVSEEFAASVSLGALDPEGVALLAKGLLGSVSLSNAAVDRLHSLSGGNPGSLCSLIHELIKERVLFRQNGVWTILSPDAITTSGALLSSNPWREAIAWASPTEFVLLELLACVPTGLRSESLAELAESSEIGEMVAVLSARGWIRNDGGRWRLSSGGAAAAVMGVMTPPRHEEVARRILRRGAPEIGEETLAELALTAGLGRDNWARCLQAARAAAARGELAVAARRLKALLTQAGEITPSHEADPVRIELAEHLLDMGEHVRALEALETVGASCGADPSLLVRYHLARGRASARAGNHASARKEYERAIDVAHSEGLRELELRSHARLAELNWESGDERTRSQTIQRVREVLISTRAGDAFAEASDALTYSLGAALIRAGRGGEAAELLTAHFTRASSDYWRMRTANAIATAVAPSGRLDDAMGWLDLAWEYASKSGADSLRPRIMSNRATTLALLGRFGDAAIASLEAASWARRLGDSFEYITARIGAATDLLYTARYDEALANAESAGVSAASLELKRPLARAYEVSALTYLALDLREEAAELLGLAREAHSGQENVELGPRLDWLEGRIALAKGQVSEAETALLRAKEALDRSPDLEDLWGVEVELNGIGVNGGNAAVRARAIAGIALTARERRFVNAQLYAATLLGKVVVDYGVDDAEYRDVLSEALATAERSGVQEGVWQLSLRMGQLAERAGSKRIAQSRFAHALRVLRSIAGSLSAPHRHSYLRSARVDEALAKLAGPG